MGLAMRVRCAKLLLSLALGLAVLSTQPSRLAAEQPQGDPEAGLTARVEKQIESIESRMMSLQEQELNLSIRIAQAQQTANAGIKDPSKAAERLAKGEGGKELRQYKAIMLSCAKQRQACDAKLLPLLKSVKALQRDREKAPEALKARIDAVTARIQGKHRANMEKIASLYERCAEWRVAFGIYSKLYGEMTENERVKNTVMTAKMAELCGKVKDPKRALMLYRSLFEAKSIKDRYRDRKLGEKVAKAYEKCGDFRSAYRVYKALHDAIPRDKREKDGKGLRDRMKEMEKKLGRPSR